MDHLDKGPRNRRVCKALSRKKPKDIYVEKARFRMVMKQHKLDPRSPKYWGDSGKHEAVADIARKVFSDPDEMRSLITLSTYVNELRGVERDEKDQLLRILWDRLDKDFSNELVVTYAINALNLGDIRDCRKQLEIIAEESPDETVRELAKEKLKMLVPRSVD